MRDKNSNKRRIFLKSAGAATLAAGAAAFTSALTSPVWAEDKDTLAAV
ncbi:MAG: twin-arginine translocation signal domain-containing protein [Desulfobacteraceae bacterium]|nr:twin-arginine translocation signal domain-containing protein [Desulfobacteraceae bacterium]